MIQFLRGAKKELGIEMWALEDVVHVAARVGHLVGKPCHAAPLPAQFVVDQFAEMNLLLHLPNPMPAASLAGKQHNS